MTVHPGFGGQSFRPEMMEKVKRARDMAVNARKHFDIEVDGGINAETAKISIENGADVLVAGTSIFRAKDYRRRSANCAASSAPWAFPSRWPPSAGRFDVRFRHHFIGLSDSHHFLDGRLALRHAPPAILPQRLHPLRWRIASTRRRRVSA